MALQNCFCWTLFYFEVLDPMGINKISTYFALADKTDKNVQSLLMSHQMLAKHVTIVSDVLHRGCLDFTSASWYVK